MTTLGCIGTSSGPLQDVEMAALSCMETSPLIPSASFRSSPLQNMEITTLSCIGRSVYTPSFRSGPFQASFRSGLFQDIEMSTLSCMETSPLIPTAFTIIQPYQSCKLSVPRRVGRRFFTMRTSIHADAPIPRCTMQHRSRSQVAAPKNLYFM